MAGTCREIDVRLIPPMVRHRRIFETFDGLAPGEELMLVSDHEPRPLYYQFRSERRDGFSWEPVERGPAVWRVRIGRKAPPEPSATAEARRVAERREIALALEFLVDDIRGSIQRNSPGRGVLLSLFDEADRRLKAHLSEGGGPMEAALADLAGSARELLCRKIASTADLESAAAVLERLVSRLRDK